MSLTYENENSTFSMQMDEFPNNFDFKAVIMDHDLDKMLSKNKKNPLLFNKGFAKKVQSFSPIQSENNIIDPLNMNKNEDETFQKMDFSQNQMPIDQINVNIENSEIPNINGQISNNQSYLLSDAIKRITDFHYNNDKYTEVKNRADEMDSIINISHREREPDSAMLKSSKHQKMLDHSPIQMRRQLTPKRYVKIAKNKANPSTSPMIMPKNTGGLRRMNKDKSPMSALERKKDKDNIDEKEINLFKKKKIKTIRQGKGDGTLKTKKAKQKDKPFPDLQSQGSLDSIKSGFGGVQGLLDIFHNNKGKDSARSEMDKYQLRKKTIKNEEKEKQKDGPLKGILLDPNRKKQMKKHFVVFVDLPEFKEGDEEAIINKNRKKYKKEREQINIHRLKKKLHKFVIKPNDPILSTIYPKYYLSDQIEKKKFVTEIEVCKIHIKFQKKNKPADNGEIFNSSINALKKTIQFSDRKNTLLYPVYRKNQVMTYDVSTYVKLIGQQTFKLYLSYRSYLIEMLSQLKEDFELILFSSKNSLKYVEKVAEALEKDNEKFFDHIICIDDMYYYKDIDFYILDLNVLLFQANLPNTINGNNVNVQSLQQSQSNLAQDKLYTQLNHTMNQAKNSEQTAASNQPQKPLIRNLKDVIVVANTCGMSEM
ncbi:nli interacting factor-like phosphatase family protein [Stylonychia lemnae]|uniref:Nli interacting factor-like phosphatase family protein n=1 Tax=Stylonychia lemnae TaxID=5949 RepID=A0A078B976_STYLE|nr:nli interacting factor-like phosphatase family protein [Stylonychia lemnae]|eukprot:CDW91070.1 nli interacting factor-like phosphatase family protein [Stylonychia lemnae]